MWVQLSLGQQGKTNDWIWHFLLAIKCHGVLQDWISVFPGIICTEELSHDT
jgi:hypothetical protein